MFSWNSEQYLRFKGERTQPAVDLANRITINPNTVIDIGCGPGNSTGLRSYLEQLDNDLQREFESDILEQIKTAYPVQKNGDIIFKFPRLFFMLVNK